MRLFDEIQAAGYEGGYTQLKEFVRAVRQTLPADPLVRFETPPAHQAQVEETTETSLTEGTFSEWG